MYVPSSAPAGRSARVGTTVNTYCTLSGSTVLSSWMMLKNIPSVCVPASRRRVSKRPLKGEKTARLDTRESIAYSTWEMDFVLPDAERKLIDSTLSE